jgi:hypothetical protein
MVNNALLIDLGGTGALAAGLVFFAVFAAIAYIAFRLLKKTVKMAFRMAVVAAILLIAVVGSLAFWWFNTGTTAERPRPAATKTR